MISMYFGSPGAGKTSLAARIVYKETMCRKPKYERVYSNFECVGAYAIDSDDLSTFAPLPHSLVLLDESGIDFNNRKYKELKQQIIEFLKLHRHYEIDIIFLSQSWEDVDITIRRLCNRLLYIRKIGPFTLCRKIRKYVMIDKESHQIVDGYDFYGLFSFISHIFFPYFFESTFFVFLRSPYYFMFDSYTKKSRPAIPRGKYFDGMELPKHLYHYGIKLATLRVLSGAKRLLKLKGRVNHDI